MFFRHCRADAAAGHKCRVHLQQVWGLSSVLTGKSTGVSARLKRDFPKLHCLAHRLELAVHDSLKVVAGCNHFEFFIAKL